VRREGRAGGTGAWLQFECGVVLARTRGVFIVRRTEKLSPWPASSAPRWNSDPNALDDARGAARGAGLRMKRDDSRDGLQRAGRGGDGGIAKVEKGQGALRKIQVSRRLAVLRADAREGGAEGKNMDLIVEKATESARRASSPCSRAEQVVRADEAKCHQARQVAAVRWGGETVRPDLVTR